MNRIPYFILRIAYSTCSTTTAAKRLCIGLRLPLVFEVLTYTYE